MNYYFIPLGYNWIVPGKPSGTEARCDALLQYKEINHLPYDACKFILTASRPNGSNHRLMADEMAEYISGKSGGKLSPTPQPLGWGTIAEIKNSVAYIKKEASDNGKYIRVHISTNPGHMPRVWLYWKTLAPKNWEVVFISADHSFSKKEWFQETAKVLRDLYRIFTGKIKRTET